MLRGVASLGGLLLALAFATSAQAAVALNEVNCEGTDWVELVNTGEETVDLSGWLLTDDPLDAARADHRLVLAGGTTLAGQASLVLEKSASGFPFGIKCGEDTIRLADGGGALVDEVVVPALAASTDTWGRYPNGTGDWRETAPSRGTPNAPSEDGGGPPADAAGWLFEPGQVVEIDLGLSDEAREELDEEPDEYVAGTFSLTTSGGTYGPYAVGVRLKGSGSFQPLSGKAAFKISFNHVVPGQRFLGLRRLTLNNMVQDPSMLHELLAAEVFRAADVPAARAGNAYVRVNGEPYGLYLDVETLDEVSLPRWFPTTRHLYEGALALDLWADTLDEFEVDEGDEDEREDLEALRVAANAPEFSPAVSAVADLDELTRMWAAERYIGHWDGYSGEGGPNNYYLHSDAAGRFSMLPSGADQTFDRRTSFDTGGKGRLFVSCLAEPACRERYRAALALVHSRVGALDLEERADELAAALAPWQALPQRWPLTAGDVAAAVADAQAFLAGRTVDADRWLASETPVEPPAPPAAPPAETGGEPAAAAVASASVSTQARMARAAPLRVGATRGTRATLTTSLRVPGAGLVTQRATVRIGSRTVSLCTVRVTARAAGPLSVRCRLGRAAQRLRAAGALRANLTTRFAPAAGAPQTLTRKLVLARAASGS